MPVYNGEEFIRKRLDNILSQTFSDFELIISDDSTDSTPQICKEYAKKDSRIRYIHQEKNHGVWKNYFFVLKEAKGEYFSWVAVDDLWMPNFLERNVQILDSKKNVVTSQGQIRIFGPLFEEYKENQQDGTLDKQYKKFRRLFRNFSKPIAASGTYEKRATTILRNTSYWNIYGMHRTEKLQSSIIEKELFVWDWAIILNVLKHGDFFVIDEVLSHIFVGYTTTRKGGLFNQLSKQNTRIHEYIFPYSTFVYWCVKNIGMKFFIKNIDYFIWLNFTGALGIFMGLIRLRK